MASRSVVGVRLETLSPATIVFKKDERKCFGKSGKIKLTDCSFLLRLASGLKHYSSLNISTSEEHHDSFNLFCKNVYKSILNDYNHLIEVHSHQLRDISAELIANHEFEACDITKCSLTARHYNNTRRNTSRDKDSNNKLTDARLRFFQEIFDSVHYFIFHLFDIGLRIKNSHSDAALDNDDEEENHDCVDKHLLSITREINEKRQKSNTFTRFASNKFSINTANTADKKQSEIKDNDDEKHVADDNNINTKEAQIQAHGSFNIGLIFYYWPYYKHLVDDKQDIANTNDHSGYKIHELYVQQKHASFKEEILNYDDIDINTYNNIILLKADEYIFTERAKGSESAAPYKMTLLHYDVQQGTPLSYANLIALILYCDFTALCAAFSSTFRPIFATETLASIKSRNRKYWWMSKILRETVQLYGSCGISQDRPLIGPFYCGMTYMIVADFNVRLCSPTSTSHQIAVALRFGDGGIVMQLNNTCDYWHSKFLRGFNCSWISAYHEEDETLFMGGDWRIRIESVRNLATQQNFAHFFSPLFYFDSMLSGSRMEAKVKKRDKKLLRKLIQYETESDADIKAKCKLDEYILKAFHSFCEKKTQIAIHLAYLHWFSEDNNVDLNGLILNNVVERRDIKQTININTLQNVLNETVFQLFKNMNKLIIYTTNFNGISMYPFSLKSLLSVIGSNMKQTNKISIAIHARWRDSDANVGELRSWLDNLWSSSSIKQDLDAEKWKASFKVRTSDFNHKEDCIMIERL